MHACVPYPVITMCWTAVHVLLGELMSCAYSEMVQYPSSVMLTINSWSPVLHGVWDHPCDRLLTPVRYIGIMPEFHRWWAACIEWYCKCGRELANFWNQRKCRPFNLHGKGCPERFKNIISRFLSMLKNRLIMFLNLSGQPLPCKLKGLHFLWFQKLASSLPHLQYHSIHAAHHRWNSGMMPM